MSVSVILCHHKGRLIDWAVDSLLASRGVDFEIIVITSDPSYQDERVRTIRHQGGPALKRNIGFRYAMHHKIAFFDDDVIVRPNALSELEKALDEHPTIGMVFGKLLNMEFTKRFDEAGSFLTGSGFLWARAESGIEDKGQFDKVEAVLAGKSAACMIRRKAFVAAGMFDASYEILGEETDLAWRVWLAGYMVFYIPSSVTYHAFNTRFKPADYYVPRRVYFNGSRNYLQMLLTNLEYPKLIWPLTCQVITWSAAALGMLLTGKHEAGLHIFKGLGWVLTNLTAILHKRKMVQSKRKIKDKDLLPIITRNPPISYYLNRFVHYIGTGRHG